MTAALLTNIQKVYFDVIKPDEEHVQAAKRHALLPCLVAMLPNYHLDG